MPEEPSNHARIAQRVANTLGPFIGLAVVIALFCVKADVREVFLTGGNFKTIFTQTVIVGTAALGMTMIIVSGGIDLSVGSVVALASVAGAKVLQGAGADAVPLVLAATILTGGLVGLVNGALVAGCRLMPFIVTLGMMGVARGAAKWLSGNQTVNFKENAAVTGIMALKNPLEFFPLPTGVWILLALAVAMAVMMRQTVFGRHIFAIGSNEATARLCGIRVRAKKIAIYSLAGLLFGTAGLMQLSRLSQGDPSTGVGLELDVVAAVVIGGASLSGGTGSVLGAMIGALIIVTLRNGSNQMGWPTYMQEIIIGIVIILAVGLDKLRQTRG
jgi:ribose transport system permease protein